MNTYNFVPSSNIPGYKIDMLIGHSLNIESCMVCNQSTCKPWLDTVTYIISIL